MNYLSFAVYAIKKKINFHNMNKNYAQKTLNSFEITIKDVLFFVHDKILYEKEC